MKSKLEHYDSPEEYLRARGSVSSERTIGGATPMKIEVWQGKRTKEHDLFRALGIQLGRDYKTGLYLRRMEIQQGPLPPYEQFLEDVQRLLSSR
jgi:hypothetical protein